jgi:hypothetical protein
MTRLRCTLEFYGQLVRYHADFFARRLRHAERLKPMHMLFIPGGEKTNYYKNGGRSSAPAGADGLLAYRRADLHIVKPKLRPFNGIEL